MHGLEGVGGFIEPFPPSVSRAARPERREVENVEVVETTHLKQVDSTNEHGSNYGAVILPLLRFLHRMHIPVLLNEVMEALGPRPGKNFADGTLGHGGHAAEILKRTAPNGRLLGIERDPRNLVVAQERLAFAGLRAVCVRGSYADLVGMASANGFDEFDGILLDLGFSSAHVDDSTRGFSFMGDGPLDMRYDPEQELTAATIVNSWSKEDLAQLLRVYGEEPQAARMATCLVEARAHEPIVRTVQLADIILATIPRSGKTHPATRTFQALRIAVNDELGELERTLPAIVRLLAPGGRLAVISFHSLEDRLVKKFLLSCSALQIITKKPITPSDEEQKNNPRSRSAKLRVAQKNAGT